MMFCVPFSAMAIEGGDKGDSKGGDPVNTDEEIAEYIQHHLKDSHDFHLFSYFSGEEEHHVGFPLPVILWGENGMSAFMSSAFHHDDEGKEIVERGGSRFVKLHGVIYELKSCF